jgi:hypothetical protein
MTAGQTSVGAGATGTFDLTGLSSMNYNGGTVSLTATGVGTFTFSNLTEVSATEVKGTFDATSATAGTASLSITENGNTAATALSSAFKVNAAPANGGTLSISPSTIVAGQTAGVTIKTSGTGAFSTTGTLQASIVSNVAGYAGLPLTVASVTGVDQSDLTANVTANFPNGTAAAAGTAYTVYVENPDGGISSTASQLTVTASGLYNVSPSSVATPSSGLTSSTTVAFNGAGLEPGGTAGVGYVFAAGTNTGTTTSLVMANPDASLVAGLLVTGPGVTAGTYVTANSSGTLTLSANATAVTGDMYFFAFPAASTSAAAGTPGTTGTAYSQATQVLTFASDNSFLSGLAVGDMVTGTGITGSTTVTAISYSAHTATIAAGTPTGALTFTPPVYDAVSTISTSAATGVVTVTSYAGSTLYDAWVMNPTTGATANAQSYILSGFAVGVASNSSPTLTSTTLSPTGAISVGSSVTTTVTLNGEGFGPYTTVAMYPGTTSGSTSVTATSCNANSAGTALTCYVVAASGALAGPYNAVATNASGHSSAALYNALTVNGPVVTAQSPASIAVGAPVGTAITLTGTGFTGATSATITSASGLAGIFAVQSATSATLTLTASPNSTDYSQYLSGSGPVVSMTQYVGSNTVKATYSLVIGGAPTAGTLQNNAPWLASPTTISSTSGNGVGVGAVNLPIIINGSGFTSGATIGNFVNANGVADPLVTVSNVTYVNANKLTATLSVGAGDVNLSDGYTLTNASGATVKVLAYSVDALFLEAGPTVTAVSPATVKGGTTTVFTLTGTNFASSNTIVTPTSNGTCGSVSVASATSMTVTCTFGAAGTTASSLVVRNNDGGQATSAAVLAAATTPVTPTTVNLHTTGAHGVALVGKTVVITITGGGFYGQPKLTSTAAGVKAIVIKDNGKMLTVRVTVRAGAARGWHTFTIRLANGKMAKVNYLTK